MKSDDKTDEHSDDLPRLWMVERVPVERFEINPSLELPRSAVGIFAELFQGTSDQSERLVAFDLLAQICGRNLRLACSCTSDGNLRPEISCRKRRGHRSYMMAKMPSSTKRPDHHPTCPFSRKVKIRVDNVRRGPRSAFDFTGRFALPIDRHVVPEAPEASSRAKGPQNELPKLMRMFAALLGEAGFSHLAYDKDSASGTDLYDQFDRLLQAAQTFKVTSDLSLQRVFSKSLYPREKQAFKRRVGLRFEDVDPKKPRLGFLALYTTKVEARSLTGPSGTVDLASNGLLLPDTNIEDYQDAPALSLVFYGAADADNEVQPLSGCTFPVLSGHCFTPVANDLGRRTLKSLLTMRREIMAQRLQMRIDIEAPLERVVLGDTDLPDFKVTALNQTTGEEKAVFVLVDDQRHRHQIDVREPLISEWRKTPGRAVFVVDEDALAKTDDFQSAMATCLV